MNLKEILKKHELWLLGDKSGEHADLHCANLEDVTLYKANLRGANLIRANLKDANLYGADLSDANLSDANLKDANLSDANLKDANLRNANLKDANLSDANLRNANLKDANLSDANLKDANLSDANMEGVNLSGANMEGVNLSGAKNLLSPINYLKENFERADEGYIVYKCFNNMYSAPDKWDISIGSVIEEEVNPNRTTTCGCGINVAPLDWVRNEYPHRQVYKLLIRWEWLAGVVVPYNTDGKIRCARAEIIERVN